MKQSSWTLSLYLSKEEIWHTLKTVILTVRSQNSKLAIKVTVPLLKASSFHCDKLLLKHRLKPYHRSSTSNLHFSAEKSHNHPNSLKEQQAGILGKRGQGGQKQSHKQMDITSHFMNLSSLEVSIKKSTWTRKISNRKSHISPLFLSLSHWCSVWLLNCNAPFKPPLHWICMIVWELLTTSMSPTQSPIDKQP